MFEITRSQQGDIFLTGRFDAAQAQHAKTVFEQLEHTTIVNFKNLEYISSAGLSVLLATQKRLMKTKQFLILVEMTKHVKEVFKYAGFDQIFQIE